MDSIDSDGITWAIACAEYHISKITPEIAYIPGFSYPELRHFINNVCGVVWPLSYLEIGLWCGATFACAMYKNEGQFIGIDDFSEFGNENTIRPVRKSIDAKREYIQSAIKKYGNGNAVFIEHDALTFDISGLPTINVFFYDGSHSYKDTRNAIMHFEPVMSCETLLIVDDYFDGDEVKKAVEDGIREAEWVISREWIREPCGKKWRYGLYVAMLRRQ